MIKEDYYRDHSKDDRTIVNGDIDEAARENFAETAKELDDALKMIVKMLTAQKEALRRTQKDSTKNFENKTDLEEGQESLS